MLFLPLPVVVWGMQIPPGGKKASGPALPTHADISNHARKYGHEAIEALAAQAAEGNLAAMKELLDRGFGKVGQPLEITGADGGPVPLELGISPVIAAALQAIRKAGESAQ